jgi:hypothetical protein
MQRNAVYHDPAHPWRQQKELELCNQIRQEWSAYDAELYFPAGRKYFSSKQVFFQQSRFLAPKLLRGSTTQMASFRSGRMSSKGTQQQNQRHPRRTNSNVNLASRVTGDNFISNDNLHTYIFIIYILHTDTIPSSIYALTHGRSTTKPMKEENALPWTALRRSNLPHHRRTPP